MKKLPILAICLLPSLTTLSQESHPLNSIIFTRFGMNTLTSVNLFVTPGKADKPTISFGLGWNYSPSFFEPCEMGLGLFDIHQIRYLTDRKGPTFRMGIDRLFKKFKTSCYLEGRSFRIQNFEFIQTCGGAPYDEPTEKAIYDWKSKQVLLRIYFDFPTHNSVGNAYVSVAGGRAFVKKHYSIEGDTNYTYQSDRISKYWDWVLAVDVGYRFGVRWK